MKTDKKSDLDYDILELQKYDILAVTRQIIREPEIEKSLKIIRENINEIVEEKEKTERRGLILQ